MKIEELQQRAREILQLDPQTASGSYLKFWEDRSNPLTFLVAGKEFLPVAIEANGIRGVQIEAVITPLRDELNRIVYMCPSGEMFIFEDNMIRAPLFHCRIV